MAETSLRRSSMLMTFGSMSSRLLGVIRLALLTATIGLGVSGDAFSTANTLPNVIFQLAAGGVLNAILVPQLVQATRRPDGGQEFTDKLLTVTLAGMAALTVLVTALAPVLIRLLAGSWQSEKPEAFSLAVAFAFICLPQVFFYGLYALLGNVLNARGHFVAFAWAPFVANVVAVIGLLSFMVWLPHHRAEGPWTPLMIWWFAGSATVSVVAQALFLIVPLRRSGFRYRPRFGLRGVGLGTTSRLAGWAFAGLIVSQVPFFVSTRILSDARGQERGGEFIAGTSVTGAAYQIFMLPHAFVTVSIVTALLPRMAAAAADRDFRMVKRDYRRGMAMPIAANVPATILVVLLARPLVTFLNPGVHDATALDATARVLAIMILGIVPFGLDLLNYRLFFALDDGRSPFLTQVVVASVAMAVTLVSLAFRPEWTAYIYATSIVVSNVASWLTGVWLVRRRLGPLGLAAVLRTGVRVLVASIVAGAVTYPVARLGEPITSSLLDVLHGLGPWVGRPLAFGLHIAVVALVFALCYVVVARAMHISEVGEIADLVLGRLGGRLRRRASGSTVATDAVTPQRHGDEADEDEEGQRGTERPE